MESKLGTGSFDGPALDRMAWHGDAALRWSLAWSGVVLLWVVAIVLLTRRMTGHLEMPLSSGYGWGAAAIVVVAAQLARLNLTRIAAAATGRHRLWITLPVLLFGAAITLPGASAASLLGCWALLLSGEFVGWRWLDRSRSALVTDLAGESQISVPAAALPAGFTQQLQRGTDAADRETFTGLLREELAEGQRVAQVHLAFCPPFAVAPHVDAELVTGPDAGLKVAQALPHGARIEIRLRRAAERPESVVLRFVAASPAPER